MIGEQARERAAADLVLVVLPVEPGGGLRVEIAVGVGADSVRGRDIPLVVTLSGHVFTSGSR